MLKQVVPAPVAAAVPAPRQSVSGTDGLVTVVVPARNEADAIEACLESILGQDYPDLQVVVVDGGSTDGTADIVSTLQHKDHRLQLVENPAGAIPVSLNLALDVARGRWLVRVDAHSTIPPDYVGRAVRWLRDGEVAGVGGRKDGIGVTPAGRAIAAAMGSRFGVGNSTYHYGTDVQEVEHVPFGAYRVDVARSLGGWDPSLRVNQDFEFDHRLRAAGHRLLFDPELVIDWHCRQTVPDLYRQYQRYGRGKVLVMRMHPSSVRVRHLLPPALVVALMGAGLVAPRRPAAAAVVAGSYAAATVLAAAVTAPRLEGRREKAWLAPAFVAMHVGWGVGCWRGVLDLVAARVRRPGRGKAGDA